MAQHFHMIEAPVYISSTYREPTMSRAARAAKKARMERLNAKFAALANANQKANDIQRDIDRAIKHINNL